MEDIINNEYLHLALSLFCIVWAVRNIRTSKSQEKKKHSNTFLTLDTGYSYLLIVVGVLMAIWTLYNMVNPRS